MWDYTDKVKEHFLNPKNAGELKDANAVGQVGSLVCGDALKLMLKVDPATRKILEAKFQTFGCASAIASSSALTEMIKGKTLDEAAKITNKDIAAELGSLPEEKMHCSVMGMEALEAAVKSYSQGGAPVVFEEDESEKIICKCFSVTESAIVKAIKTNGLKTVEEVTNFTKAGGACGKCKPDIQAIINKHLSCEIPQVERIIEDAQKEKTFESMTVMEKIKTLENTLNEFVRPALARDGGSVELADFEGARIKLKLTGACAACSGAAFTLKNVVEKILKEKVSPDITVESV